MVSKQFSLFTKRNLLSVSIFSVIMLLGVSVENFGTKVLAKNQSESIILKNQSQSIVYSQKNTDRQIGTVNIDTSSGQSATFSFKLENDQELSFTLNNFASMLPIKPVFLVEKTGKEAQIYNLQNLEYNKLGAVIPLERLWLMKGQQLMKELTINNQTYPLEELTVEIVNNCTGPGNWEFKIKKGDRTLLPSYFSFDNLHYFAAIAKYDMSILNVVQNMMDEVDKEVEIPRKKFNINSLRKSISNPKTLVSYTNGSTKLSEIGEAEQKKKQIYVLNPKNITQDSTLKDVQEAGAVTFARFEINGNYTEHEPVSFNYERFQKYDKATIQEVEHKSQIQELVLHFSDPKQTKIVLGGIDFSKLSSNPKIITFGSSGTSPIQNLEDLEKNLPHKRNQYHFGMEVNSEGETYYLNQHKYLGISAMIIFKEPDTQLVNITLLSYERIIPVFNVRVEIK